MSLAGSNFEIDTDANLKVDDASPSIDWASVNEIRKADTPSGNTDESFGQGTKEDTAVPSIVDGSIPPNKSDLKFFGVYQEGTSSDGFLNLFWSRVQDPSGTTNMDFELNKRQCTPNTNDPDCSANGVTPIRSVGDALIIYDLSQGGTRPTLSIRRWTGSAWGPPTDLTASGDATGSINISAIPGAESDGLGPHSPRTFGEAQVKLSALFGTSCEGFGSAYLKSRSSDSFTAALKDFVPPVAVNISSCGLVNIHKTDQSGNPLANAQFTLFIDASPFGGSRGANDNVALNVASCVVPPATTCSCTTDASGNCTISGVPFGNYWAVETVVPTGYNGAPDQAFALSGTASTITLTFENQAQPGTISVHKVDDLNAPVPGATFTLFPDNAPLGGSPGAGDTPAVGTCTTDSSGNCSFANVSPGTYWVVETGVPDGYSPSTPLFQQVTLGPAGSQTVNFTDPRKFHVVVFVCQTETKLHPSGVSLAGGVPSANQTTLSSTDINDPVLEARLCGSTFNNHGRYDNRPAGNTGPITVSIP